MRTLVRAWSTGSRVHMLRVASGCTRSIADVQASAQFRAGIGWSSGGAPSRIRTCAHGSGGQCCVQPLPGKTCHVQPAWGAYGEKRFPG